MNKKITASTIVYLVVGYILIIFLTFHASTTFNDWKDKGIKFESVTLIEKFTNEVVASIQTRPFKVDTSKKTLQIATFITFAYLLGIAYYYTTRKKLMPGREHGSARWSDTKEIKSLVNNDPDKNVILTQTESLSLEMRKTRRNLNTLIVGGSGSGKTRFFLKPNLMQLNTSFVTSDPKGEILRSCGKMLKDAGYRISVLNLIDMNNTDGYNPFTYLREGHDEDVMTLINTIMQNTNPEPKGSSGDPFWEKSEMLLLQSLFYYLIYEAPEYEQNIPMVMELVRAAEVKEDDPDYESDLDLLFKELKEKDPKHIAIMQYDHFKIAAGKTAKSIIISVAARLGPYNIKSVSNMSKEDSLGLSTIGEEKTALFVIISPTNTTFNFIAAMMYSQLFAELDYVANWKHGGTLPILVRFLLDEFANIGRIPNFEKILAYARSLGLGIVPIFQSIGQLKEMYKDSWETLMDNCDTFLFLGGQGTGTLEYISKKLGFQTIDTKTTSISKGRNSSSSQNFGTQKRELMTPDEIGEMPENECILFVKGKRPFRSKKFDITKHKNYPKLEDSDATNKYEHMGSVSEESRETSENPGTEIEDKSYVDIFNESETVTESYVIKDLEIEAEDINDLQYEVDYENDGEDTSTDELEEYYAIKDLEIEAEDINDLQYEVDYEFEGEEVSKADLKDLMLIKK